MVDNRERERQLVINTHTTDSSVYKSHDNLCRSCDSSYWSCVSVCRRSRESVRVLGFIQDFGLGENLFDVYVKMYRLKL